MFFRNYALRFFILLTITSFNIVYSSALTFIDMLNAESRRVVEIPPAAQLAFQEFFDALNFDSSQESLYKAQKNARGAFTKIPVGYHSNFIATINTLPIGIDNYQKADLVLLFSMFQPSDYQQITDEVRREPVPVMENIRPVIFRLGRKLFDGIDDSRFDKIGNGNEG